MSDLSQGQARNLEDLLKAYSRGPRRMLDPTNFSECLLKERVRCDRGGPAFCLLILESTAESGLDQQIEKIGAILSTQLRITDELGRLETGVLRALLTDTSVNGAWIVAKKVIEMLPDGSSTPLATVYSYPTDESTRFETGREGDEASPDSDTVHHDEPDEAKDGNNLHKGRGHGSEALQPFFAQPMSWYQRLRDIIAAAMGLLFLSPLLLLVGLLVKATSEGPVLFRQQRTGLGGKPFTILKFRTMRIGAEEEKAALLSQSEQDGPAFKMKDDPRITSVGGFLRRTSIDELPQLWNVLRGDMTLVGPRPLPCKEIDSCSNWQRRRLDVTPGLTCTWQVSGRSMVSFSEWMRLDLDYIQRRSASGDLSLIVRTIRVVFKGTGR